MRIPFEQIVIEPCNMCNLRCPVCPVGQFYEDEERGFMSFKNFKSILDPLVDELSFVELHFQGEPFLAPDIFKMIDYVCAKNKHLTLFTNGCLLNKDLINKFKKYRNRIDIFFSIDGISSETYASYRYGGDFHKAIDNMRYFVKMKKKYKMTNLQVNWHFLVMKTNIHEVPAAKKIGRVIGVNNMIFKAIRICKEHDLYDMLHVDYSLDESISIKKENFNEEIIIEEERGDVSNNECSPGNTCINKEKNDKNMVNEGVVIEKDDLNEETVVEEKKDDTSNVECSSVHAHKECTLSKEKDDKCVVDESVIIEKDDFNEGFVAEEEIDDPSNSCFFVSPGSPVVRWNGKVYPCRIMGKNSPYVGDALKESIVEIWNSERFRMFRDKFRDHSNIHCNKECPEKNKNVAQTDTFDISDI